MIYPSSQKSTTFCPLSSLTIMMSMVGLVLIMPMSAPNMSPIFLTKVAFLLSSRLSLGRNTPYCFRVMSDRTAMASF